MKELFLIPNLLTLFRIFSIPIIIYYFKIREFEIAIISLTLALLTDFFDGFIARKWNQTSFIGAILDPVADKLMILSLFYFLITNNTSPLWYFIIILIRNTSQLSAIPVLLVWKKIYFKVKPKFLPKLATALCFILLFYFLAGYIISIDPFYNEKYDLYYNHYILNILIFILLVISIILELYILITFLPRYYKIYKGIEDTFE
jgi:cardiolipin synthase